MHPRYLLFIAAFTITGCASPPETGSAEKIGVDRINTHQQRLATIEEWEFQARMAFFNDRDDERHTASVRWQQSPQKLTLHISHPLRGTLAKIEQTPERALMTDREGNQYMAPDISELLQRQLGIALPVNLINNALLGRHPEPGLSDIVYYDDGTLAEYQVRLPRVNSNTSDDADVWRVELFNYQSASEDSVLLPHRLHLDSADYRVRLAISRWQIDQESVNE